MYLLFEYLIYAGLLLIVIGGVWLLSTLLRRRWRRAVPALALMLVGVAVFVFPMAYTRLAVDLGPHEAMVNAERHLTLTGWDRDTYDVLASKQDAVVLQMANPDVTDDTLQHVGRMSQLRELDLNDSQVTDRGLAILADVPSLQTLKLRGTAVTDAGFRDHLLQHANLIQLDVRQTAIRPETIDQWKAANPQRRALQ